MLRPNGEITDHFVNNHTNAYRYVLIWHISVAKALADFFSCLPMKIAFGGCLYFEHIILSTTMRPHAIPFALFSLLFMYSSHVAKYNGVSVGVSLRDVKVTGPTSTDSALSVRVCVLACERVSTWMSHTATATRTLNARTEQPK